MQVHIGVFLISSFELLFRFLILERHESYVIYNFKIQFKYVFIFLK